MKIGRRARGRRRRGKKEEREEEAGGVKRRVETRPGPTGGAEDKEKRELASKEEERPVS